LQTFAPANLWRPDVIDTGTLDGFKIEHWQSTTHDPALFEGLLAMCQANLDLKAAPGSQPSKEVLRRRGNVISSLRKKLASEKSYMDISCFLSIIGLMALDVGYFLPQYPSGQADI
jgi:hypothetical protein